jgi:DNA (cytosine-5)-methyltransferase 1
MNGAYYNEYDPVAAEWLRELIKAGLIAPGEVDERSIEDVTPKELEGFVQCHFFAGIGIWSHALRLAGWPDDRPVWTGSCPCQPFSAAGKGKGTNDERHLWPAFHHLIRFGRPRVVFGEQVASKGGLGWLDIVSSDMEAEGYAIGAIDLCAAGFGSPQIRQRLFFVADAAGQRLPGRRIRERSDAARDRTPQTIGSNRRLEAAELSSTDQLGHALIAGLERHPRHGDAGDRQGRIEAQATGHAAQTNDSRPLADTRLGLVSQPQRRTEARDGTGSAGAIDHTEPGPTNGFWADPDWLFCRDERWRPVEAGTFPLAYGNPGRMGRLRGFGNAISPYPAKAVIEAYQSSLGVSA